MVGKVKIVLETHVLLCNGCFQIQALLSEKSDLISTDTIGTVLNEFTES